MNYELYLTLKNLLKTHQKTLSILVKVEEILDPYFDIRKPVITEDYKLTDEVKDKISQLKKEYPDVDFDLRVIHGCGWAPSLSLKVKDYKSFHVCWIYDDRVPDRFRDYSEAKQYYDSITDEDVERYVKAAEMLKDVPVLFKDTLNDYVRLG